MKTGICNQCGKQGAINTHHKDFNHGLIDPLQLEDLCPSCHRLKHGIAKREALEAEYSASLLDQSQHGWSKDISWDELLAIREYPSLAVWKL